MNTVIKHMGISQEDYNQLVWGLAIQYLRHTDYSEPSASLLLKTPFFWAWWTKQFERRNRILVHKHSLDKITPDEVTAVLVTELFLQTHSAEALDIFPNDVVLENTYEEEVVKPLIIQTNELRRKES